LGDLDRSFHLRDSLLHIPGEVFLYGDPFLRVGRFCCIGNGFFNCAAILNREGGLWVSLNEDELLILGNTGRVLL
jgi:hypothetical protein